MKSFDLYVLIWPTVAIFLCTLLVSLMATRKVSPSIFFAFVKSMLFLFYYGVVFDGTYTFLDDITYLEGGLKLHHEGVGFGNLVDNFDYLLAVGGGEHVYYYLQNSYAIRFFGYGYYSPVALNIILTVLVAYLGKAVGVEYFHLSERSSRLLYFFLLVHPDILAWSTIFNGKDVTVLFLHLCLLFSISLFVRGKYLVAFCVAIPSVTVLFFLRFYVPLLFACALVISMLLGSRWQFKKAFFVLLPVLVGVVFTIGVDQISYAAGLIREGWVSPLLGFVRTLLTPVPFNTEPSYAFLDLPALVHWFLIPFLISGVLQVYRLKTISSRFFLVYFFLFLGLYSVFLELQGPRHRVQLDYAIASFQFLGISLFLRKFRSYKKEIQFE